MINAVLFDLHGVITSSPWAALAAVGAGSGRPDEEVLLLILGDYAADGDHPWHRLERGEIGLAEYGTAVTALATEASMTLDFGVLRGFSDSITVHAEVVDKIVDLRAMGIKTALVTNNVKEMAEGWRRLIDADALFDAVIDSSSVGVRKPDPTIFTMALARLGDVNPADAVFLDDVASNVAGAESVGINGIVVHNPSDAMGDLDALIAERQG